MNLFKLVGSIFIDNEEANKSISKTDSHAESLAQKFVKGVGTAAKWGAGIAVAATGAATAVGATMVKIADDTREYREEMGKLETAFESSDHSADVAKKTYQGLQKVLGETDQSVEATNHLAKLCKSEEQLSKWTDICTGVYAEFGASLPIEGLTEAANETAKTGALTGGLADALNWAGVNEEQFQEKLDECNNEQERSALITETLNGLYAESAEKYKENNKEILAANEAQEKLNATMALIGEKAEPVVNTVKLIGATILEKTIPAITGFGDKINEKLPTIEELSAKIDTAVQWFSEMGDYVSGKLKPIFDDFRDAVNFLKDKLKEFVDESDLTKKATDTLKDAVELLADAYNTAKGYIKDVVDGWKDAVEWGKEHETELLLLADAFGTLTAAIIAYNIQQGIKNAGGIVELAQLALLQVQIWGITIAENAATIATTAFGVAVNFLTSPVTLVVLAIGALIAVGVLLAKNWDTIKEKASEIWSGITEKFEKGKEKIGEIVDTIKGFFTGLKLSFPDIKMPHFSIKPKGWKIGDLLEGDIPKIDIEWYDKAMDKGMIMNGPTIFGYDRASGKYLGGGETGSETIVGTNSLFDMIQTATSSNNEKIIAVLVELLNEIKMLNGGLYDTIVAALQTMGIEFDERELGRLVRKYA